jgi:hypothetical protein
VANGTNDDDGLVSRQDFRRRIAYHPRRIYAQEELSFTIHSLVTIDPPSDMLTVGEPAGNVASGVNPGAVVQGVVGFSLTHTTFAGIVTVHVVAPIPIVAADTPMQTAQRLVIALSLLPNIAANASQNAAENGAALGSVDVVIRAAGGTAAISNLTALPLQDAAQPVDFVHYNVNAVDDEQSASELRKGGPPMRRQLFKSQVTTATRISIFVVREARGGLTTSSLHQLTARGLEVDAAVRNCLTMSHDNMSGDLTAGQPTLPHEMGHALTDADHVPFDLDIQTLMSPGQMIGGHWYDSRRISGPGSGNHHYQLVGDDVDRLRVAGNWINPAPPMGHLDILQYDTTMHDLIAANVSLTFTPR